jgi:hypothetical protein
MGTTVGTTVGTRKKGGFEGSEKLPETAVETKNLKDLEVNIRDHLLSMKIEHVRFTLAYASGEDQGKSYLMAGYTNHTPEVAARRLLCRDDVKYAVYLLRRRYALENGLGLAYKRQRAIDAINLAEREKQPNSMISGIRLLAEMDGDIGKVTTAGGVEITIVTGVDRGVTIENE